MISPPTDSDGLSTTEIQGSFSYELFCVSTARTHDIAFPPNADSLVDLPAAAEAPY